MLFNSVLLLNVYTSLLFIIPLTSAWDDGMWHPGKYDNSGKNNKPIVVIQQKPNHPGVMPTKNIKTPHPPQSNHEVRGGSKSTGKIVRVNGKKLVCYFEDWVSNGQFGEGSILDAPCTHVIYSFATLDPSSNKMIYNYQPKHIKQIKQKGIKVMLAVGGAVDSKGEKYSSMASTKQNRKVFIDSVVEILNKHGFDGFDVDWEYPTCRDAPGDCGSLPQDKEDFVSLIRELRKALGRKILTIASHPLDNVVSKAFNIPALSKELDWYNVMTYDLHGSWDYKALHHSPLFAEDNISFEGSVKLYKSLGVPPEKIVLGTPTYGRSLKLQDPAQHRYGAPVTGPGDQGPYTRESGLLSYLEICEKVKNSGWKTGKGDGKVGPYAYGNGDFVGFDDAKMAEKKALFVKEQGLGGMMVWSMGSDDFRNACGCGKYPVISALYNVLVKGEAVQDCQI